MPELQPSHGRPFAIALTFLLAFALIVLITSISGESSAAPPSPSSQPRTLLDDYNRAVLQASKTSLAPVSHSLEPILLGQQVRVVTWTRAEQVPLYKNPNAFKEIWVTRFPHPKDFCQQFVREHGSDSVALSQRLKQRLGLPPSATYDTFVELLVTPKGTSQLFRPCGDPNTATDTCAPAKALSRDDMDKDLNATDPQQKELAAYHYWFSNNYYDRFSSATPYPWTALGYTFDWATIGSGNDFVTLGESEFVIPKGAPIQFVSDAPTALYCAPK